MDVSEPTVGFRAQFDGIAMTRHLTVGDTYILAEPGRSRLQGDAVVIAVRHHSLDRDLMAAIEVKSIVIIVISVKNLDSIDIQTVTGKIVLHPAAAVSERDILDRDVFSSYNP